MIVITMNNCPMRLRGDLSKWLAEINTGVFVGHVNAKVREKLWERICSNIKDGQATMVYNMANEQRMEFKVHNTKWQPKDYEGIKLIKRPFSTESEYTVEKLQPGFSKAAKRRMGQRRNRSKEEKYIFLDIETTGLDSERDKIIEIAAICSDRNEIKEEWSTLISYENLHIPKTITELTGITEEMCKREGVGIKEAIIKLNKYLIDRKAVIYNASFDLSFLEKAAEDIGKELNITRVIDVPQRVKKYVKNLPNNKMETAAKHFNINTDGSHRALKDCTILYQLFFKLNEI